eukprot:TRINITY_DN10208_c0_g1_i1.p1 TRINITY_DN10208_c0_g1~~TRINITY_DN10208_c0_g1_i1.p1  ORF type:complete len:818 (-),score=138.43 TRINITY_DN10208_c0_g1_i1:45-2498(-)
MGNSQMKIELQPINNEKLQYLESVTINGMGNLKIYQRENINDGFAISTLLHHQFSNYQNYEMESRLKLKHPHQLGALGIDNKSQEISSHVINNRFFFEYCQITLEALIEERLGSNKLFPEEDLMALLKGMISVLAYFEENNITFGDCHPSNIYFDTRFGAFKVFDIELLAGRASAFYRALDSQSNSVYLSPELIVAMREEQYQLSNQKIWKSDIFALGMTLLEAACLRKSSECYDKNYSILAPIIKERLQFVTNFYSQEFSRYLTLMLDFDENNRLDSLQLWQDIMAPTQQPLSQTKKGIFSPLRQTNNQIVSYNELPKITVLPPAKQDNLIVQDIINTGNLAQNQVQFQQELQQQQLQLQLQQQQLQPQQIIKSKISGQSEVQLQTQTVQVQSQPQFQQQFMQTTQFQQQIPQQILNAQLQPQQLIATKVQPEVTVSKTSLTSEQQQQQQFQQQQQQQYVMVQDQTHIQSQPLQQQVYHQQLVSAPLKQAVTEMQQQQQQIQIQNQNQQQVQQVSQQQQVQQPQPQIIYQQPIPQQYVYYITQPQQQQLSRIVSQKEIRSDQKVVEDKVLGSQGQQQMEAVQQQPVQQTIQQTVQPAQTIKIIQRQIPQQQQYITNQQVIGSNSVLSGQQQVAMVPQFIKQVVPYQQIIQNTIPGIQQQQGQTQQQFLIRQVVGQPGVGDTVVTKTYIQEPGSIQKVGVANSNQKSPSNPNSYQENQSRFSQNIQKIKDEIAQSKLMIENYQQKLQQQSPIQSEAQENFTNKQQTPTKYQQVSTISSNQKAYQLDQLQTQDSQVDSLETRIKSVIQRSQEIRKAIK